METSKLFRNAHGVLRQIVEFSALMFLVAQVLTIIVFPIIETSLREINDLPKYAFVIIYGLHIIIGAYALIGLYKLKDFIHLAALDKLEQEILEQVKVLEQERDKKEQFSSQLNFWKMRARTAKEALSILHLLIREHVDQLHMNDNVSRLLTPLIQRRFDALGFNSNDLYNFVVYLFDPRDQELKICFRDCDNRIKTRNRGWKVGVGHVGHSFAYKKTIVANMSDESKLFGDGEYLTDKEYYASFLATPIFDSKGKDDEAIGVFAITSSRDGHLNQDHQLIAETFALILSVYFSIPPTTVKNE